MGYSIVDVKQGGWIKKRVSGVFLFILEEDSYVNG